MWQWNPGDQGLEKSLRFTMHFEFSDLPPPLLVVFVLRFVLHPSPQSLMCVQAEVLVPELFSPFVTLRLGLGPTDLVFPVRLDTATDLS